MSNKVQSENYMILGNSFLESGHVLKARKFFKKAYEADPTNIDVLYEFALLSADQNDINQALKYYDEILKINNQEAGAYYGKAIIFDDQGKASEAEKYYQEAIKYDQDYYHAYLYLADIYERKNDLLKAEAYYLKALDLGPYYIWSYINYGAYLESHQRDAHALIIFMYANHLFHDHYLIFLILQWSVKK